MGPHAPARAGRHGHLVLEPAAESLAPGSRRAAQGQHVHDLAHPARGRPELAEEPHLVRNRRGDAQAQTRWRGARQRSRCHGQKKLIEQAYTLGAQLGLSVWCEDEAGPFQAVPHPGTSWQPRGQPALQPHEYIRGGTTKILTLFHPASGRVRLQPAARCTNAVLHPWLRERLSAILAELPPRGPSQDPAATQAAWAVWQEGLRLPFTLPQNLPPLRLFWCGTIWPATRRPPWCCGCARMGSCRSTRRWAAAGSTWPSRSSACSSAARWTGSTRTAQTRSDAGLSRRRGAGTSSQLRSSGMANAGSGGDDPGAIEPIGSAALGHARTDRSVEAVQPKHQNASSHGRRPTRRSEPFRFSTRRT